MKEAVNNTRPTLNVIFILVTRPSIRAEGAMVNIPFRFHAGGIEMESGRYLVRPLEDNVLRFSAVRTTAAQPEIMILGNQADSGSGTLAFLECGDRYLLSKAFWPSVRTGRSEDASGCVAQRNPQPMNMLIH